MSKKMSSYNTRELKSSELLLLHSQISEELRDRGITRTSNNPTGDLAEYLFCNAFGWVQETNSSKGIDAISTDGVRYQIKARRITKHNGSRQLSAIRNLLDKDFDFLAGVLFTEDYKVFKAAIIPRSIIIERAKFSKHTNSHIFQLRDDVWQIPSVQEVTQKLVSVKI